jgi:hypothetical protein
MSGTAPLLPSVCLYDLLRDSFTLTLCSVFTRLIGASVVILILYRWTSKEGFCRMSNSTVTAMFSRVTSGWLSVRPPVNNSAEFVSNLDSFVRCRIFCLSIC